MINELIKNSSDVTKQHIEALMQQQSYKTELDADIVFSELSHRPNIIWNFLLHTGYLTAQTITQDISGAWYGELVIPNKEITLLLGIAFSGKKIECLSSVINSVS